MIDKIKAFVTKYYEQLSYLFFGGLATLLNLVLYEVFLRGFGVDFASGLGNILNNCICILFAYFTNRTFVFKSKNSGQAALKEFGQFVGCRIGTMVLDQFNLWLGVEIIGKQFFSGMLPLWARGIKLASQVIVILANYVFSKILIFKKKA